MQSSVKSRLMLSVAITGSFAGSAFAGTPAFTNLYSGFSYSNTAGGYSPTGPMVISGNTLYGVVNGGGANSDGFIFSMPTSGGTPTDLYDFKSGATDGGSPAGGLLLSNGLLYGTTSGGGTGSEGTIFSFPLTGGTPTILGSFNETGGGNGGSVSSPLTLSNGVLYGESEYGGPNYNGSIFSMPVGGGAISVVAQFNSSIGNLNSHVPVTIVGNTIYTVTYNGGTSGNGAIISVPTNASNAFPTVVASFTGGGTGTNGESPESGLTLSKDGTTLYGETESGGPSYSGNVFSIPVGGSKITDLSDDANATGYSSSYDTPLLIDGTLYLEERGGGSNYDGTLVSLSTSGGSPTLLYDFSGTDGSYPEYGLTEGPDGTLYGITTSGPNYAGTIFSLSGVVSVPEPATFATLGVAAAISLLCRRRRTLA